MYNVFVIEHNIKANPKESNAGKKKKKRTQDRNCTYVEHNLKHPRLDLRNDCSPKNMPSPTFTIAFTY